MSVYCDTILFHVSNETVTVCHSLLFHITIDIVSLVCPLSHCLSFPIHMAIHSLFYAARDPRAARRHPIQAPPPHLFRVRARSAPLVPCLATTPPHPPTCAPPRPAAAARGSHCHPAVGAHQDDRERLLLLEQARQEDAVATRNGNQAQIDKDAEAADRGRIPANRDRLMGHGGQSCEACVQCSI